MTLCELITKPIKRLVEEDGKNLDEIAEEVCPSVEFGREKIIRVIKDFIGEEYLIQHADVLKYDIEKASLAKKRKNWSHKKIDARVDSESSDSLSKQSSCDDATLCCGERQESPLNFGEDVFEAIRTLIEIFGLNQVQEAFKSILSETPKDTTEETSPHTRFPLDFEAIKIKNLSDIT
jgi:hypothetical protein